MSTAHTGIMCWILKCIELLHYGPSVRMEQLFPLLVSKMFLVTQKQGQGRLSEYMSDNYDYYINKLVAAVFANTGSVNVLSSHSLLTLKQPGKIASVYRGTRTSRTSEIFGRNMWLPPDIIASCICHNPLCLA